MDIIDGEVIQPFDPATGKLNDSLLSGNVLVADPDMNAGYNYIYAPNGNHVTLMISGTQLANPKLFQIKGQTGGKGSNGVAGGELRFLGGRGGSGNNEGSGGAGGNITVSGGPNGYPGSQPGGSVSIRGGYDNYGGVLNGSVYIGDAYTRYVSIGQGSGVKVGFFDQAGVVQQTGGSLTAGNTYTATEKQMIQKAYDCLRAFGLLS